MRRPRASSTTSFSRSRAAFAGLTLLGLLAGRMHAQTTLLPYHATTYVGSTENIASVRGPFFSHVGGVAVAANGAVYAIDVSSVQRINPDGTVTRIAGDPQISGPPVDSRGIGAWLGPTAIALDSFGNIFTTDLYQCIRKVTPDGTVTTFAGSPTAGDDDGIGTAAKFRALTGIAIDRRDNTIYVSDSLNHVVRKITSAGVVTHLTTFGAQLANPQGLAVDASGNLYIADLNQSVIFKVTPASVATIYAGTGARGNLDGPAAKATFMNPEGLALDASGNLYVSDTASSLIRKITPAGIVSTVAGTAGVYGNADGVGTQASFWFPPALSVDASGNIFVADGGDLLVRKISPAGVVTTVAGGYTPGYGSQEGNGTHARIYSPHGITVDAAGNTYIADTGNHVVRKVNRAGLVNPIAGYAGLIGSVDGFANGGTRLNTPTGVAVAADGSVFVADSGNGTIRKVTPDWVSTWVGTAGSFGTTDGTGEAARFTALADIVLDSAGTAYVSDNHAIRKISSAGVVTTFAGAVATSGSSDGTGTAARFARVKGLALDRSGNLYAVDSGNWTIRKITPAGVVTTIAGVVGRAGAVDGPLALARFADPDGIAVDASGNLYVGDNTGAGTGVRRIGIDGMVTTLGFPGEAAGRANGVVVTPQGTLLATRPHAVTLLRANVAPTAQGGASTMLVGETVTLPFVVSDPDDARLTYTLEASSGGVATIVNDAVRFSATTAGTGSVRIAVSDGAASATATMSVIVAARGPSIGEPAVRSVAAGGAITLGSGTTNPGSTYLWSRNGQRVVGADQATLRVDGAQARDAGVYSLALTTGAVTTTQYSILGPQTTAKVIGSGSEIAADIQHPRGNIYDQVLLQGDSASITADPGQVTRLSYLDVNDDIVQVEFSGSGTLSVVLDGATGPAAPVKYNQSGVTYMKGHATLVVVGADRTTNLSVFSVGRDNAVNQDLFRSDVTYDGFADLALIAISSTDGKFGGLRTANASYFATRGLTGVYAPGVEFTGPLFVGDVSAADTATPVLVVGAAADARITGGDLFQANGQVVQVKGLTRLRFTDGSSSHSQLLPAQQNRARLEANGVDVTASVVQNP